MWLIEVSPDGEAEPAPQRPLVRDAHVHRGVSLHGPGEALLGLLTGGVDEPLTHEETEEDREQDDDDRASDELRERELPAEQEGHDDAQLDHQVRAADFEDDRRGEVWRPSGTASGPAPQRRRSTTSSPRRGRSPSPAWSACRLRARARWPHAVRRPGRRRESVKPRIRDQAICQAIGPGPASERRQATRREVSSSGAVVRSAVPRRTPGTRRLAPLCQPSPAGSTRDGAADPRGRAAPRRARLTRHSGAGAARGGPRARPWRRSPGR